MSSDLVRTVTSRSRNDEKALNQRECDQVYTAIKRWKAHDGAVLLPVVRKDVITALKEKAKPRWWKMKKSGRWNTSHIVTVFYPRV